MMILTVVLCSLALVWLTVRLLNLFSIPIDEAIKILNITVPKSPVVSIDSVTTDSVGLHWEPSNGASSSSYNSNCGLSDDVAGQNSTGLSAITHYLIYLNGIELAKIPGTESSVVLTSLSSNSHYQVDLVAFNNLNFRSRSSSIYVRTTDKDNGDIEKKLLNIADDSTQVLPCDPKLLYEDNVDEKLRQQIQPVQNNGRSRSSTLENASMISLSTLAFPTPSEITNIEDLKFHLERAQEDLRNTMIQQSRVLADFNEQEKGYKSTLVDLNERMKIEDKNRSASKLELSYLEDAKLKLRGRIDKLKQNLTAKKLEIEKKELQIAQFENTLNEKQDRCDDLIANEDKEFHGYEQDIQRIRQEISDLLLKNQTLEDSVKSETVTRKKLESLKTKLVPIFIALGKATNAEGDLEKEGIVALAELKLEHAEWYQTIKNLIDTTSQDRAQGIAQKLKIESKLEQHKRQILLLKEETDALKTAKKENSTTLLRNTYINNDNASSISNLNLIALLSQPARTLAHQQSIPSIADHISNSAQQMNVPATWGFSHSRIPSQNASLEVSNQYDTSTELQETNFLLTMLPNELLEDVGENFFRKISGNASMNRVDTFYSTTSNSAANPFGGMQDNSMSDYNNIDQLPFTAKSVRYDLQLDNNSLALSGHNSNGNNTPTYPLASSPPVSSNTHISNPSAANIVNNSFGGLTSFNSNDSFLPITSPSNSEYLSLSSSVFPNNLEHKEPHPSAFSARRLSKTFNFLKSNEQPNHTISSTLPSSSHNTTINTSRFFSWKKPPKSPDEQFQPSFAQINSLGSGIDALAAANLSRERSGSFNSHNSSSIWNNYSNSATNYNRFLDNPLSQRPSFELMNSSSPRSTTSGGLSTSPLNIPGVLNFDTPQLNGNLFDSPLAPLVNENLSDTQMRKYPTRSSASNLTRENSNLSNASSSQLQEPPSSPSYFKKIFAGTSPLKHEKNSSINSNTISMSTDSELGEPPVHSSTGGRNKIFKINRKNSNATTNSVSTSNSATAGSNLNSIAAPSHLSSSVGSNSSSIALQQSSSGSSASSTSKKLKNLIFPKRKGHEDEAKTDTEDTIEEASDESSLKE